MEYSSRRSTSSYRSSGTRERSSDYRSLESRTRRLQESVTQLNYEFRQQKLEAERRRIEHEERMRKYQIEEKREEEKRRLRMKEREELRNRTSFTSYSSSYRPSSTSSISTSYTRNRTERDDSRIGRSSNYSSTSSTSTATTTSSQRRRERDSQPNISITPRSTTREQPSSHTHTTSSSSSVASTIQTPVRQERSNFTTPQNRETNNNIQQPVVPPIIDDLPLPFPAQPAAEAEQQPVSVKQFLLPRSEECTKYCPILCRETDNWVQTPCGHCFDEEAITTWLSQPNGPDSCPICRTAFRVFDKRAQHEVALNLGLSYINNIATQYNTLWASDRTTIIQRFWDDITPSEMRRLAREFRRPNSTTNISDELDKLLEDSITEYSEKLHRAIYSIVLKDIKVNLKHNIPLCYQSQLDKDIILYIAYCLTTVVPAFYIKWWKRVYTSLIREGLEEIFLRENT